MNEQQQAEILAGWLESGGEIPQGLDEEVVEAVLALQPQRAPAPKATADEILATVTNGPLATPMPINASVGPPPSDAPTPQKKWWFIGAVSIGGLSSLAAAAVVMLAISQGLLNNDSQEFLEPAHNQVAAAPARAEGAASKKILRGTGVHPTEKRAMGKPSPPRARPARQEIPTDAVAFAEDEAEEERDGFVRKDLDEGVIPELGSSRAAKMEPTEPSSFDDAPLEQAATARPAAARPAVAEERGDSEADQMIAPPPAAPPPPPAHEPTAPMVAGGPLAREAKKASPAKSKRSPITPRTGTEGVHNAFTQQAERALTAGDPNTALQACIQGLKIHTEPSPTRQLLFALKGDAHAALGDTHAANSAWSKAKKIARTR